ncbi:hypothetical protein [Arcobacter sp. FWKO B]|uniref:hypothetical protein n=1 Tax=Arcobacter sp. FWKO B TaxID=2593672 RepID=UPI001904316E|nr:hypothetical protein [Arcobacter sp. FWKO B]
MNFYKLLIYILIVLFIIILDNFVFQKMPKEKREYSDFEKILIIDALSNDK